MTHVLCLGDSITDCGRLFLSDPLGDGYVKQLSLLLENTGGSFSITNRGVDGFTLENLLRHVSSWIADSNPDIITVLIGINDIGLMMNTRRTQEQQQLLMKKFSFHYEQLAEILSQKENTSFKQRSLFFLEPFIFSHPQCYMTWKPLLSQMSDLIRQISRKYGAVFVPLQDDLNQEASRFGTDTITTDGIHLTLRGHRLLAENLYSSITSER